MSSARVEYGAAWWRGVATVTAEYAAAARIGLACARALARRGLSPLAAGACADGACTALVFCCSALHANSSVYDPYWHVAPPLLGAFWAASHAAPDRAPLAPLCVLCAWAVRLTCNWARGWAGLGHEDWRYARLKEKARRAGWPAWAYWLGTSLLGFHAMPTAVVLCAMLPLHAALAAPPPADGAGRALRLAGLALSAAGVAVQALADEQLRAYRAAREVGSLPAAWRDHPYGEGVACVGLWRRCRHPNYLGELCHWGGYPLLAAAAAAPSARASALALGCAQWAPLLLLFSCASVPMMEERQRARRPGYARYCEDVPPLLPLPWRRARRAGRAAD